MFQASNTTFSYFSLYCLDSYLVLPGKNHLTVLNGEGVLEKAQNKSNVSTLILGSTGMLGQALVKEAKSRKMDIITVARNNADFNVDFCNRKLLLEILTKLQPATVINSAAIVDIEYCERNPGDAYLMNSSLVGDLSSYCEKNQIKFCQISTDHFFSGESNRLHKENCSIKLLNEYARTKYAGEMFALLNPSSLVLRTNVVGFRGGREKPTFLEWLFRELRARKPIVMFEDFYTSSIDVASFSKSLYDLISIDAKGLVNLAARECFSKRDFIQALATRLNYDLSNCRSGRIGDMSGVPRATSLGLDVSLAESLLGYKLPDKNLVVDRIFSLHKEYYEF